MQGIEESEISAEMQQGKGGKKKSGDIPSKAEEKKQLIAKLASLKLSDVTLDPENTMLISIGHINESAIANDALKAFCSAIKLQIPHRMCFFPAW